MFVISGKQDLYLLIRDPDAEVWLSFFLSVKERIANNYLIATKADSSTAAGNITKLYLYKCRCL